MIKANRGSGGVPNLAPVTNIISQWMDLWRAALGTRNQMAVCLQEETMRIARRLAIRPDELDESVTEGPDRALPLQKMLVALGIDPETPALQDPAVVGELRRQCARCRHKTRCERDLAETTAAKNFSTYCPNTEMLDAICVEMTSKLL